MGQHIIKMRLHHLVTRRNIRFRPYRPSGQQITCLCQKPGPPLCAAADHYTGSATGSTGSCHITKTADIANNTTDAKAVFAAVDMFFDGLQAAEAA